VQSACIYQAPAAFRISHDQPTRRTAVIFLVSLPAAAGNYRPDNGCTLDYPQSVLKNGSFKLDKEKGSGSQSIALSPNADVSVESGGCLPLSLSS
jgi:hypothetical protein